MGTLCLGDAVQKFNETAAAAAAKPVRFYCLSAYVFISGNDWIDFSASRLIHFQNPIQLIQAAAAASSEESKNAAEADSGLIFSLFLSYLFTHSGLAYCSRKQYSDQRNVSGCRFGEAVLAAVLQSGKRKCRLHLGVGLLGTVCAAIRPNLGQKVGNSRVDSAALLVGQFLLQSQNENGLRCPSFRYYSFFPPSMFCPVFSLPFSPLCICTGDAQAVVPIASADVCAVRAGPHLANLSSRLRLPVSSCSSSSFYFLFLFFFLLSSILCFSILLDWEG